MQRMSRAGRKALLLGALQRYCRKYKGGYLTTPKLAHSAGLMSSSNVKNMLRELEEDGLIVGSEIEPFYACGYTQQGWTLAVYKEIELPERYILINGIAYWVSAEE